MRRATVLLGVWAALSALPATGQEHAGSWRLARVLSDEVTDLAGGGPRLVGTGKATFEGRGDGRGGSIEVSWKCQESGSGHDHGFRLEWEFGGDVSRLGAGAVLEIEASLDRDTDDGSSPRCAGDSCDATFGGVNGSHLLERDGVAVGRIDAGGWTSDPGIMLWPEIDGPNEAARMYEVAEPSDERAALTFALLGGVEGAYVVVAEVVYLFERVASPASPTGESGETYPGGSKPVDEGRPRPPAPSPGAPVPGDANGDSSVTALDAMIALKMSVKLVPERTDTLDQDGDGEVTSRDAALILSSTRTNR